MQARYAGTCVAKYAAARKHREVPREASGELRDAAICIPIGLCALSTNARATQTKTNDKRKLVNGGTHTTLTSEPAWQAPGRRQARARQERRVPDQSDCFMG